jgi:GDPmannose 4,6-dehydratase
MKKSALITGITGQDGSILAELLLKKGYEVSGIIRRSSSFNTKRIDHLFGKIKLFYGDMGDTTSLVNIISKTKPDEIYNLAAQSHVSVSFETPEYTANSDALGVLRLLETVRSINPKIKIYQASTSELFGKVQETPQKETTPFYPRSPYGVAKLYAYWITINYREAYDMFVCNGILFNHCCMRRGGTFVSQKIARYIQQGNFDKPLQLGNLNAERDWGYAPEYVEAMWLMMQQENPDDFVIGTGEKHSVREFCEKAFNESNIELEWIGEGINEKGIGKKDNKVYIEVNEKYFRPTEVDLLIADPSKAEKILGWKSQMSFDDLVTHMVEGGFDE